MQKFFWKGISKDERHLAINDIKSVISKYGDIVDVHLFSDVALSMLIEVEESKINSLHEELSQIMDLQGSGSLNALSGKECIIYFSITFSKGTGNLRIDVPAVPG